MNKKGVELAMSSIVIIILAVIVLAVLAIGFSTGWGKMWNKVNTLGGDVKETAVDACKIACAKQNSYAVCEEVRAIGNKGETGTCADVGETCAEVTC